MREKKEKNEENETDLGDVCGKRVYFVCSGTAHQRANIRLHDVHKYWNPKI